MTNEERAALWQQTLWAWRMAAWQAERLRRKATEEMAREKIDAALAEAEGRS